MTQKLAEAAAISGYARPVALYNLGLGRRDDVARNFFTASVWFGESKAVKGEINGDARKSNEQDYLLFYPCMHIIYIYIYI